MLHGAAGAHVFLSSIYIDMGKYETSQKFSERGIDLWKNSSMGPSYIIWAKILIALARVMNHETVINMNAVFKWYEKIQNKWAEGFVLNCIGTILLNINNQHESQAKEWIKKSIETNQKYGMMWNLARDYALYAEFYRRRSYQAKARENLIKAIETFKECEADGWVEKYQKELAEL